MRKYLLLSLMALLPMTALITLTSCGDDDEIVQPQNGNETGNNDGDNNDGNNNDGNNGQLDQEIVVTVDANGNADGGHIYTKIDESNFYIDDIKYTDVSGNLEVTGYNEAFFNGTATIISALKYEGRGTLKVAAIAERAFYNCTILKSIIISNGITSIGNSAFYGCSRLTSITVPNSVKYIDSYAFVGCNSLKKVIMPDIAAWCGIYLNGLFANPLYYAHHLYMNGKEIKDLVIPESVKYIGRDAFSGCSGLTSITIPNSVTDIGYEAFYGCSSLTSVTIPNSVTGISDRAFDDCSSLTSVTLNSNATVPAIKIAGGGIASIFGSQVKTYIIGSDVTSIRSFAFSDCSGLTSVTIGSGVTLIDNSAFSGCSGLKDVYCLAESVPQTDSNAFYNSPISSATLHVPAASIDAYKTTSPWSSFGSIVAIE